MKDEIKEILEDIGNQECYYVGTNGCLYQDLPKEQLLLIKDYITNLQQENERLKILNKTAEIYIRNHTIDYIEDGIECVKPSEYFNMLWPVEILNGDTEGIEILVEEAKKEIEGGGENE